MLRVFEKQNWCILSGRQINLLFFIIDLSVFIEIEEGK